MMKKIRKVNPNCINSRAGAGFNLGFRLLDPRVFGRGKRKSIVHDLRQPNDGIKSDFKINELFIGRTAVISPHFDDASLNYGGGIYLYSKSGGQVHTVNVSPGYRVPIRGIPDSDVERKIAFRVEEGKKESKILGTTFHFLNLKELYDQRKITEVEALKFYGKLDEINPMTIVVPGPFDAHPDHQNSRILAINWAVARALGGKPVLIVEAPSIWGSIPETQFTHLLQLNKSALQARKKAQWAHKSQLQRTAFDKVALYRLSANAIVGGELVHGLVLRTPVLKPTEFYSQHVVVRERGKIVFKRLDKKTKKLLK